MLDFQPLRDKKITLDDMVTGLTPKDLAALTNEMIDAILVSIADCEDADVIFVPEDPQKNDTYAQNPAEADLAWTLGHVIAHATASSEESAFLAAELARGVENHGRSRYETPWQEMTSIAACRLRLEESRRMRLASLQIWPDQPHLQNTYEAWKGGWVINALGRFVFGLMHDDSHLAQISEIARQARVARTG